MKAFDRKQISHWQYLYNTTILAFESRAEYGRLTIIVFAKITIRYIVGISNPLENLVGYSARPGVSNMIIVINLPEVYQTRTQVFA